MVIGAWNLEFGVWSILVHRDWSLVQPWSLELGTWSNLELGACLRVEVGFLF